MSIKDDTKTDDFIDFQIVDVNNQEKKQINSLLAKYDIFGLNFLKISACVFWRENSPHLNRFY